MMYIGLIAISIIVADVFIVKEAIEYFRTVK